MSAANQPIIDELRRRLGDQLQCRAGLAAGMAHADAVRRLDANIEQLCRDLAAAERGLSKTT